MFGRSGLFSRVWRSVTFVMALRAVAKTCRSPRLYPVASPDGLDVAPVAGRGE